MEPQFNSRSDADRYDIVLDLIGHPEKYSPRQIEEILSDPGTREIYNLLCKTESSLLASSRSGNNDSIDLEWDRFAKTHLRPRFRLFRFGNRAASIAIFTLSSLAAVAISIALCVNLSTDDKSKLSVDQTPTATVTSVAATDSTTEKTDSIVRPVAPLLFENESLGNILNVIAANYGLTISYTNPSTAGLHLYYKFDPSLDLDEIIGQLNTFEQINIRLDGKILYVD